MYGANVLIFEGILSFTSKELRDVSTCQHVYLSCAYLLSHTTVDGYENICGHRLRHSPSKKVARCSWEVFMYFVWF